MMDLQDKNLTKREVEVLELIAEGFINKEIAEKLCVSVTTIKKHIESIYEKWSVHNKVQAVVYGVAIGVICVPDIK